MKSDNVTAAPSAVRPSRAEGRTVGGGAAFRLPDQNSPTYAARCFKAGLEGLAPVDATIDGTIGRVLLESHLVNRARHWTNGIRDEFNDLVKDSHTIPTRAPLVDLQDAVHEVEYDLRDEWTWPTDHKDATGPENSPSAIHRLQRDHDLHWNETATGGKCPRVRYRARLYYSILTLEQVRFGLFAMREKNLYGRDLSGAAWHLSTGHAFRRQLKDKTNAEQMRVGELALLDRLMSRSAS